MLKAVIFDIDGVLVDSKEANIDLFKKLLVKAGYPEPAREEILTCFHMPAWQTIEKLTRQNDPVETERIWKMIKDPDLRNADLYEFPKELDETLQALHQHHRLAIVTGRVRYGVDEIFEAVPIEHLFDVVIAFEDYDNPKPHPEPLLTALKRLRIDAAEAVYIGDSNSDIEAAQSAGIRSIHLSLSPHKDATAVAREFKELLATVKSLD